jgi:integral membrane protein (TIGR00529 family)
MVELIKIGIVFFIVLILTFKRVNLWIALLAGTFLLGALFHQSLQSIVKDLFTSILDTRTLLLLGAFVAILLFSTLLKETGRMGEILEGLRTIFKDMRVVIALLPAMIGLMPLMGGALVSAPMVVEGSDELKLSPERRAFINYWFRHIWQYTLPTYPSLILAATLIKVPMRSLAWMNLPLTLTAIASGILFGFWGVSKSTKKKPLSTSPSILRLFYNLCPLLIGLILVIVFQVELAYAFGLVILGMTLFFKMGPAMVLKGLKESLNAELLLTVAIVMGFKKVLESSQVVHSISSFFLSSGIPLWLIAIFVPFLIGLTTGLTIAPIAIGFPVLIPLFQNDPYFLNYMVLAFASGISGDLLSPFHLCLILTKDYFKADLKGIYRFVWVPSVSIMLVALLIVYLR